MQMNDPFWLILSNPMFWDVERSGSVNKHDPLSTQIEVVETRDGFGWTAAWVDHEKKKSGKSKTWFPSISEAKADLKGFLEERRREYLESRASPACIGGI
jgi:hypothetical protein